jgi:NADH:ubiquinone oxidoreductase subunit K
MQNHIYVQLFHILIIGGLFFYVGTQQTNIHKNVFPLLLVFGLIIVFYHAYKATYKYQQNKSYWINLFHILFVGPLLIYIGYYGVETQRMYFELLLMMCFAVIGYHGYYLLSDIL